MVYNVTKPRGNRVKASHKGNPHYHQKREEAPIQFLPTLIAALHRDAFLTKTLSGENVKKIRFRLDKDML